MNTCVILFTKKMHIFDFSGQTFSPIKPQKLYNFFVIRFALKLTYSNVENQTFLGEDPGPPF
jgi:hypothetical protein